MRFASIPALVLAALALALPAAHSAPLDRPDDPVVVTGAGTPGLVGAAPGDVVAFAWSGSWQQIPVQVDERKLFDLRAAYPTPFDCAGNTLCYAPFSTPRSSAMRTRARCRSRHRSRPRRERRDRLHGQGHRRRGGCGARPGRDGRGLARGGEGVRPARRRGGVRVPVPPRRRARPERRPAVRELHLQADLGRLSGDLQVRCGNESRDLDGRDALLLARLHRPLAREPAARPPRRRDRRRHPRPHREPVQSRLLRAQHPHLRRRRGRLPREPERPRARDPRLSGGEQRSDDGAAAGLLRGPRGGHDLPPRPRHPRRHELPRLQRRSHRDDLPEQQQPRRRDDRRPGRRRDPGHAHLGERGRGAGGPDERPLRGAPRSPRASSPRSTATWRARRRARPRARATPASTARAAPSSTARSTTPTSPRTAAPPPSASAVPARSSSTLPDQRTGRCAASRSAPGSPPTSILRPPVRPPPARPRPAPPHPMPAPPRRPRRRSSCPSGSATTGGTEAADATGPCSPSAAPG